MTRTFVALVVIGYPLQLLGFINADELPHGYVFVGLFILCQIYDQAVKIRESQKYLREKLEESGAIRRWRPITRTAGEDLHQQVPA